MITARKIVEDRFKAAGVQINGPHDWDIQVHDERLYNRLVAHESLGLGESYMEKWWDCERVDLFIERLLRTEKNSKVTIPLIVSRLKALFLNLQSRTRARQVVDAHYDLGNDLYMSFLDPYNQYTCGYFKGTDDLNLAQEQKLELICKKLYLKRGDRVLDIGCGWGGFAKYAAEHYGCQVVGITISDEQIKYARQYVAGLPVEIRKQDYRDLVGEKLHSLQKSIEEKLSEFRTDDKEFNSHITTARVKSVGNKRRFLEEIRKVKLKDLNFEITNFYLVKSELKREGANYKVLEKYSLV